MKTRSTSEAFSDTIDVCILLFLGLLYVLTTLNANKIADAQALSVNFIKAAVLFLFASFLSKQLPEKFYVTIKIISVVAMISFLFSAVAPLQHILLKGWMDDVLLRFEYSITGTETSVYLQRFIHPVMTEWMMFAYVIYVPLLVVTAFVCYKSGGARGAFDYLLCLVAANILCDIGFILFPVASQMYHNPHQYSVPLQGWVFTWCGEWMRSHVHFPGGSLPSPHCAAGTVMMIMMYRYHKKIFTFTAPIFITIYFATVYGRYHYVWDSFAGILVGIIVVIAAPKLVNTTQRLLTSVGHPLKEYSLHIYTVINRRRLAS